MFQDLYLVRFVSVVIGLFGIGFAWAAFGLALGDRTSQLIATGVITLLPMASFLRAGTNADVLVGTLVAALFWLAMHVVRGPGLTWSTAALAGLVLACGVLTKQTFTMLVAGWGFVVLVELFGRRISLLRAVALTVATVGILLALAAWFFVRSPSVGVTNSVAEGSTNGMTIPEYLRMVSSERWADQVNEWWGVYGWLDTGLSSDWYRAMKATSLATVIVGAGALLLGAWRRRVDPAVVLALAWVALWSVGLAYVEFSLMRTGKSGLFVQGRYYIPLLVPTIFLAVAGWRQLGRLLPNSVSTVGAGVVLPSVVALHVVTLVGYVIPRYYL